MFSTHHMGIKQSSVKGERLMTTHCGNQKGFVGGAVPVAWEKKSSPDYHHTWIAPHCPIASSTWTMPHVARWRQSRFHGSESSKKASSSVRHENAWCGRKARGKPTLSVFLQLWRLRGSACWSGLACCFATSILAQQAKPDRVDFESSEGAHCLTKQNTQNCWRWTIDMWMFCTCHTCKIGTLHSTHDSRRGADDRNVWGDELGCGPL